MTPDEAKAAGYEELDYPDRGPRQIPAGWVLLAAALCVIALLVGPSWLALIGLPVLLADMIQRFRRGHWIVK